MTKREKNLIFFAVLLLLAVGYGYWMHGIVSQTNAYALENENLTMQKQEMEVKIAAIDAKQEMLDEAQGSVTASRKTLQDSTADEAVDEQFTALAEKYGMAVNSVAIQNDSSMFAGWNLDLSYLAMTEVTMQLTGTNAELIALYDALNAMDSVLAVSLTQSEGEAANDYTLKLVLFME